MVTYTTTILGFGNHAAIEIPIEVLEELGANKRAPLIVRVSGHTYRSTATGMDGKCLVVFPQKDRDASGVKSGDTVSVELTLDVGRREVEIPDELFAALLSAGLVEKFELLTYSKRKEFCRLVTEAKTEETRLRRVEKVLQAIK